MLIPSKYEDISKNLLSVGVDIFKCMGRKKNLYLLYKKVIELRNDEYPITFNQYLLSLDFLYSIGKIDIENKEIIKIWF